MTSFRVEIDRGELAAVRRVLSEIKNGAEKAIVKAINTTLSKVKVEGSKLVRAKVNLSKKIVDENIYISKASYGDISGRVDFKGKRISLIHFAARQTAAGVTFKIKKDGARSLLKKAFIHNFGDYAQVFKRKYDGPDKPWDRRKAYAKMPKKYRFPIEKMTGPSIGDVASWAEVLSQVQGAAAASFLDQLDYQVSEVLRRANL